jgi:hypothetical protein
MKKKFSSLEQMTTKQTIKWFMKYTLVTLNIKKKYDETNGLSSAQDQPPYKHNSKTKNRLWHGYRQMLIALSPNLQAAKAFHAQNWGNTTKTS